MRYASNIQLDQIIVHILDPRRPDGFVLSERAIPLERNQRLVEYFVSHIQNSLKDSTSSAACFVSLDDNMTSKVCRALLDGNLDLVAGSKKLAERLYKIIKRDERIKAGDLAVCFYRAGNRPNVPRYLALLKIDPSEVFRHKTEQDPLGKRYVNFEIETNVMPTTREKLQKCAFIQSLDPRQEYDMILLDRQVKQLVPQPLARFFVEDFLGAALALDARQRTDLLYRGLVSARNQLHNKLHPHEEQLLSKSIHSAITSAHINIDTWLEALPLAEEYKEQIDHVVSEKLPDREFEIDATYVEKLSRKRSFRGDRGLQVNVSAERYKQVIVSEQLVEDPGEPPYYRIEIHTEKWEETTR